MTELSNESMPDLKACSAEQVAIEVARFLDSQRATAIKVLDIRQVLPITSYFVLANGSSTRAVKMLTDGVEKLLRRSRFPKRGVESDDDGRWLCIDYDEVVVHVFDAEAREFYDMDHLWGDAKTIEVPLLGASGDDAESDD